VHELLGHEGCIAGPLELREHVEDVGTAHVVLTGVYHTWVGRWGPGELPIGQPLREPRPLFRKLDPEQTVAEELERMERSAGE
jgi:methionyl-tRNA synthetase